MPFLMDALLGYKSTPNGLINTAYTHDTPHTTHHTPYSLMLDQSVGGGGCYSAGQAKERHNK